MLKIEYFDHTADLGIRVTADTLEELFTAAGHAVIDSMLELKNCLCGKPPELESEILEIQETDLKELFFEWLDNFFYYASIDNYYPVLKKIEIDENQFKMKADIRLYDISLLKAVFLHEIKTITRHNSKLEKKEDLWTAEFICDI